MWALIVAALLPAAIRGAHRAVEHLFRPETAAAEARSTPPPAAAVIERAVRFLLIVAGVWVLVWGWDLDFGTLTNQDDFPGSPGARSTPWSSCSSPTCSGSWRAPRSTGSSP